MRMLALATATITALGTGAATAGSGQGDPEAGYAFAQQLCAQCHHVEADWVDLSESYAPPFVDIADNTQLSDMAIRVFLQTPHKEMPNFVLTQQQIDDVIAYIATLRQPR